MAVIGSGLQGEVICGLRGKRVGCRQRQSSEWKYNINRLAPRKAIAQRERDLRVQGLKIGVLRRVDQVKASGFVNGYPKRPLKLLASVFGKPYIGIG